MREFVHKEVVLDGKRIATPRRYEPKAQADVNDGLERSSGATGIPRELPWSGHAGQVVPDTTVQVTFELHGAARLAAVGNGNPHNVDSFTQPRRYTWHCRALAILRLAKNPRHRHPHRDRPGLRPAGLTLKVKRAMP